MTTLTLDTGHKIEIEAPDGAAALELERRLAHLAPTAKSWHDRWLVDLTDVESVEGVVAEARTWLRQMGIASTMVGVDGRRTTLVPRPRGRHRAINEDFIG